MRKKANLIQERKKLGFAWSGVYAETLTRRRFREILPLRHCSLPRFFSLSSNRNGRKLNRGFFKWRLLANVCFSFIFIFYSIRKQKCKIWRVLQCEHETCEILPQIFRLFLLKLLYLLAIHSSFYVFHLRF